jgi:hypothetical protein
MKYSLDNRVSFDSKTHSYFLDNKKLISVTTLLNKYKNKFDSEYWSKIIAKRENISQSEVLEKWKKKAFKSTEIGTAIHKIFEDYVNNDFTEENNKLIFKYNNLNDEFLDDFNAKKNNALNFINDFFITKRIIPLHSEYICYNEKIAGQIDLICKDQKDNYYILDFKTNEKIDFNSYNNIKTNYQLNFLEDSSYWHYCIQLSIYKELCKEFNINKLFLVHITNEKYEFIECKDILKQIELNDLF